MTYAYIYTYIHAIYMYMDPGVHWNDNWNLYIEYEVWQNISRSFFYWRDAWCLFWASYSHQRWWNWFKDAAFRSLCNCILSEVAQLLKLSNGFNLLLKAPNWGQHDFSRLPKCLALGGEFGDAIYDISKIIFESKFHFFQCHHDLGLTWKAVAIGVGADDGNATEDGCDGWDMWFEA